MEGGQTGRRSAELKIKKTHGDVGTVGKPNSCCCLYACLCLCKCWLLRTSRMRQTVACIATANSHISRREVGYPGKAYTRTYRWISILGKPHFSQQVVHSFSSSAIATEVAFITHRHGSTLLKQKLDYAMGRPLGGHTWFRCMMVSTLCPSSCSFAAPEWCHPSSALDWPHPGGSVKLEFSLGIAVGPLPAPKVVGTLAMMEHCKERVFFFAVSDGERT